MLLCPSALASTIRARNARSCAVLRRFAQFSNVCCSSCDNTSGASTGSPILPAHCTPAALSSSNQSAEAKGDSSGDRELKTGTLDVSEHRTLPAPGTTISGTLHLTAASTCRHDHGHGGGPPTLSADHLLRVSTERCRAAPSRTRRWPARRSRSCQVAKARSRQTRVMARGDVGTAEWTGVFRRLL